jgi:hypothetical protein
VKDEVLHTLSVCIFSKRKEEAMFWTYELYYSGWIDDLFALFSNYQHHPILHKYIMKKQKEWYDTFDPNAIGSIMNNILLYHDSVESKPKKRLFVLFQDAEKYQTIKDELPRKILARACIYSTIKRNDSMIANKWRNHWLYYAWFSPIWKWRIEQYGGNPNHEINDIRFHTIELEEEFYDAYWYEPDEQTRELQEKMVFMDSL